MDVNMILRRNYTFVSDISKMETGASPIDLYSCEFRIPAPPHRPYRIPEMKFGNVSGKGWSDEEAQSSCLGEAVEHYSAVFRGDEPAITSSFAGLRQPAIDPRSLLLFSARQYAGRNSWNATASNAQYIPEPWKDEFPLEWTPCRSLSRIGTKLVPTGTCFLRYTPPEPRIFFPNLTPGCAAATTIEEATLRGFLELVERDAVALWWYNRCRRPAIDMDRMNDDDLGRAQSYLSAHGRSLHVLDVTSDFGIPVVVAVSATATAEGEAILMGMAADFDLRNAVRRAVAELFQVLGPDPYWSRESMLDHYEFTAVRRAWLTDAKLENQEYILPQGISAIGRTATSPSRRSSPPDSPINDSVPARLEKCVQAAERVGAEILVCDMTRADVGVPVVRVIVPGLRTNWAQLGPGRLYETPVTMGWQSRVLTEDELNPFPFFL